MEKDKSEHLQRFQIMKESNYSYVLIRTNF
jgi:hypothetical protein